MNHKDVSELIRDSWIALAEGDFLEPNLIINAFIKHFKDLEDEGIINFDEQEFKNIIYSKPVGA